MRKTLTLTFDITGFDERETANFVRALVVQAEGVTPGDIADTTAENDYTYPQSEHISTTVHVEAI